MRRVVVTGLGAVTPLGIGLAELEPSSEADTHSNSGARASWKRLVDAQSGIVGLDAGNFHHDVSQQRSRVAGLVPPMEWNGCLQRDFTQDERRQTSTFMKYALVAAQEALGDAQWHPQSSLQADMTGVCIGSGIGSLETMYDASTAFQSKGAKRVSPYFIPKLLINLAAGHVSMKFGLKGPSHAATTACTTGAHAIGDAARLIAFGDANVMLAGGAESCIHPLAFVGFERSRSLCVSSNDHPAQASRPFDQARDGFVIGEGAAILVLEELQHAVERGVPIYAELKGYGMSSDAHHPTAPPASGHGALRAMQRALIQAKMSPKNVDYINAHATSTVLGDAAEMRGIDALVQGDWWDRSDLDLTVSSNKGAIGHLLGAAGAVEAMFTVLAIRDSIVPPTLNLNTLDGGIDKKVSYVKKQSMSRPLNVCLSNSFGFGGTNASLCFTNSFLESLPMNDL